MPQRPFRHWQHWGKPDWPFRVLWQHQGKRNEARDLLARIIQHETDHLDGVVFLDRVDVLTRHAKLQEWQETRNRLLAAVQRS